MARKTDVPPDWEVDETEVSTVFRYQVDQAPDFDDWSDFFDTAHGLLHRRGWFTMFRLLIVVHNPGTSDSLKARIAGKDASRVVWYSSTAVREPSIGVIEDLLDRRLEEMGVVYDVVRTEYVYTSYRI